MADNVIYFDSPHEFEYCITTETGASYFIDIETNDTYMVVFKHSDDLEELREHNPLVSGFFEKSMIIERNGRRLFVPLKSDYQVLKAVSSYYQWKNEFFKNKYSGQIIHPIAVSFATGYATCAAFTPIRPTTLDSTSICLVDEPLFRITENGIFVLDSQYEKISVHEASNAWSKCIGEMTDFIFHTRPEEVKK